MNAKNAVMVIATLVLLLLVGFVFIRARKTNNGVAPDSVVTQTMAPEISPSASASATTTQHQVNVNSAGFSPQSITIKAGETITWTNTDSSIHTVNSDPHPTHTLWPFINTVSRIQPGETKSLQFPNPGTYTYHDHLNPQNKGTVVVQ